MGGSVSVKPIVNQVEKDMINEIIRKNCIVVFSKTYCVYCKRVKKLFKESNVPYLCIELDKRTDGKVLQNALHEMTGANTVPRVFINSECIGGASEVQKLHSENQLMKKIKMCQ